MKKRFLAAVAAPAVAAAALAAAVPAASAAVNRPADFTGGSTVANVKIVSWDDGCLTYAHPVLDSALVIAPCDGGHNFDLVRSADGLQAVWKVHGANLAVGDSGGVIVLRPFNTTSDSLVVPQGTERIKNGFNYQGIAFSESNPHVFIQSNGNNSQAVSATTTWTVHDDYRSEQV